MNVLIFFRAHVIASGVLQRTRMEEDHFHIIEEQGSIRDVYSSLHLLNKDPTFATVTCESGIVFAFEYKLLLLVCLTLFLDSCKVYSLSSDSFNKQIDSNPALAKEV